MAWEKRSLSQLCVVVSIWAGGGEAIVRLSAVRVDYGVAQIHTALSEGVAWGGSGALGLSPK